VIKVIERDELKAKLERGDDFRLVMTMGDWAYQAQHIPGSLNISRVDELANHLSPADEIVVYCAGVTCPASIAAYHYLVNHGFANVRRYAGGLEDWAAAGYPLEGSEVESQ
jgi:rhodanese-related sulfurtransferase